MRRFISAMYSGYIGLDAQVWVQVLHSNNDRKQSDMQSSVLWFDDVTVISRHVDTINFCDWQSELSSTARPIIRTQSRKMQSFSPPLFKVYTKVPRNFGLLLVGDCVGFMIGWLPVILFELLGSFSSSRRRRHGGVFKFPGHCLSARRWFGKITIRIRLIGFNRLQDLLKIRTTTIVTAQSLVKSSNRDMNWNRKSCSECYCRERIILNWNFITAMVIT